MANTRHAGPGEGSSALLRREANTRRRVTRRLDPHELTSAAVWRGLLGTKVSLRFRLHDDPAHPFSEAVGMVKSVAPDDDGIPRLTVVNRRGHESSMALGDILAAKVF